jgi:hypothetical protein
VPRDLLHRLRHVIARRHTLWRRHVLPRRHRLWRRAKGPNLRLKFFKVYTWFYFCLRTKIQKIREQGKQVASCECDSHWRGRDQALRRRPIWCAASVTVRRSLASWLGEAVVWPRLAVGECKLDHFHLGPTKAKPGHVPGQAARCIRHWSATNLRRMNGRVATATGTRRFCTDATASLLNITSFLLLLLPVEVLRSWKHDDKCRSWW